MADQVYIHGVAVQDVLDRLPLPSGSVTDTSQGLNTAMIERWIRSGAGVLNSILRSQGKDPVALGIDEKELVKQGIISYAEAYALKARSYDQQAEAAFRAWDDTRRIIREIPSDMTPSDDPRKRIVSSSGTADKSRWGTNSFRGW